MDYPYQILIVLMSMHFAKSKISEECQMGGKSLSYLEVAVDMIAKAKVHYPSCPTVPTASHDSSRPIDCEEILRMDYNTSGVYTIWPRNRILDGKPLDVYCDMVTDGGGWTVLQRRGDFNRPNDYFFKDWDRYKTGFGDIEEDFWIGNDNMFALTNQLLNSIRFDLMDVEGNKTYALYDTFWIDDENSEYTLHIKDYSGNAGDSMNTHNNQKFSTKDKENDSHKELNCAQKFKGAWWYNVCHHSNLNGLYLKGKHESFADGINWYTWKGHTESLETTEMKIRPKNFRKQAISLSTPRD